MGNKSKILKGYVVSKGIAIGRVWSYEKDEFSHIPKYKIKKNEIESEFARLKKAIKKSKNELEELYKVVKKRSTKKEAAIFQSHILMLDDPYLLSDVEIELKTNLYNIETALFSVVKKFSDIYNKIDDKIIKSKSSDVIDVGQRIIKNLILDNKKEITGDSCELPVIMMAKELIPSITVKKSENILGIITEKGEITSHAAILARSFNIPSLVNIENLFEKVKSGDLIILDCLSGKIIVSPSKSIIKKYQKLKEERKLKEREIFEKTINPVKTLDGVKISVMANMGYETEIDNIFNSGADGVGLFRTEFLFMKSKKFPTETKQFNTYKKILKKAKNKNVTIRVLDIASDKKLDYFKINKSISTMLGFRGIRILLVHRDIFKTQLKALFRASIYGNLKILFPMITNLKEIRDIFSIISDVKKELRSEKIEYSKDIKFGVMIEVPSTLFLLEELSEYVDFFSIGTNDLIQYMFAADRNINEVSYLYNPFDISILRVLKRIADFGKKSKKSISVCGEIAGDPYFTNILINLGFRELSMSVSSIPTIKQLISTSTIDKKNDLYNNMINSTHHDNILEILRNVISEKIKNIEGDLEIK